MWEIWSKDDDSDDEEDEAKDEIKKSALSTCSTRLENGEIEVNLLL